MKRFIRNQLKKVFDGEEIEVVPSADRRPLWAFTGPEPLTTYLQLQHRTCSLLRRGWTHLFVIAESGAWMASDRMLNILSEKVNAKILCIETSMRNLSDWHLRQEISKRLRRKRNELRRAAGECTLLFGQLAWWKHNRHLTLAYNADEAAYLGGIFFRRNLKATQIAPVYVQQQGDCAELLLTFMSYAKRVCEDHEETGAKSNRKEREELCRLLDVLLELSKGSPAPGLQHSRDQLLDDLGRHREKLGPKRGQKPASRGALRRGQKRMS
jgi:hypothetical protein